MRLIDADELLKAEHKYYYYLADEHYIRVRDVEDAPTIEERKKGKWLCHDIREGHLIEKYSCAVCDYYSGTKRTNFCPNCGADMREEKTDG